MVMSFIDNPFANIGKLFLTPKAVFLVPYKQTLQYYFIVRDEPMTDYDC